MKARWIVLLLVGAIVVASWSAMLIAYLFFDPPLAVWAAMVTVAALSLEGFFWIGAAVLGWSFLAGRRAAIERLRQRLFGGGRTPTDPR